MDNTCVCCGAVIPEGRQVCLICDNTLTDYDKCLKWICEQDASICDHPSVFSCTWIAEGTGIPVRKVRKIMKQLAADGYVFKNSEGGWDEWHGKLYCIHGYSVTKKATQLEYWQKRYQEDVAYWEDAMNEAALWEGVESCDA